MRSFRFMVLCCGIVFLLGVVVQAEELIYRGDYSGLSKCFDAKLDVHPFISIAESIIQTKCPNIDTTALNLTNVQLNCNYDIASTLTTTQKIKAEPKCINVTIDYVLMNTGRFSVSTSGDNKEWHYATYDQLEIIFTTFPKSREDPNPMVIVKKGVYQSVTPKLIQKKN
jgi:hypothetical protein